MSAEKKRKLKKTLLLAFKIAVGSGAAIYIAEALHLEYAVSAGTVTLLSLLATKWETIKFSVIRLGTFLLTALMAFLLIPRMHSEWVAYGVIVFLLVFLADILGWRATLSVNAVVTAHYMARQDFSTAFFFNEFLLVFIGVVIAFVLNLFHLNKSQKKHLMEGIRYVEEMMQSDLRELSEYLMEEQMNRNVWEDIRMLEGKLQEFMEEAREYQDNTFESHHDYYLDYFEMRLGQCRILDSLHYEMKKMRSMPRQAGVVADYIRYLADYVTEKNIPEKQAERLEEIFEGMKKEELPGTREEFESRAMLYHVLMDLEEFLKYKQSFVEELSERQREEYW